MEYDFPSVFTDLFLTALLYCSVPLLSVLFFKSLSKKAYKLICILWPAVVFLAIQWLYTSNNLGPANMPAAFIWGFLSYKVGVRFIRKTPSSRSKTSKAVPSKTPPDLETWYTCPCCGSLVHTGVKCDCGFSFDSSSSPEVQEIVETYIQPIYPSYGSEVDVPRKSRVSSVLVVLLVLSIISSVVGWTMLLSFQSSYSDLEAKYDELSTSYSKLKYNASWYQSRTTALERKVDSLLEQLSDTSEHRERAKFEISLP